MTGKPLIYRLLPELYRRRDRDNGLVLEAVTASLDHARATIERDISRLYRNWFVETCDPEILPYLAELVGVSDVPAAAGNSRALVADTIDLARRKGTYPATERMLSHLSGWPVLLSPAHESGRTRVEVWRNPSMPLRHVAPRPATRAGCYRFHPMGVDCRLTVLPRPFPGYEAMSVRHLDAPVPLMRDDDPALLSRSIEILIEEASGKWRPLQSAHLTGGDLSRCGEGSAFEDRESVHAVVDPELGRLRLFGPASADARVAVSFGYSAAGAIGGGSYERAATPAEAPVWLAHVHSEAAGAAEEGRPPLFASIAAALEAYRSIPGDAVIRILDSASYEVGRLAIGEGGLVCPSEPNRRRRLTIEAISGEVPTLHGTLHIHGTGAGLELRLGGLWIDGRIRIEGGVTARVEHCSIHALSAMRERDGEGRHVAALSARGSEDAQPTVHLDACLTGPLRMAEGVQLVVRRSVVDGYGKGMAVAGRSSAGLSCATILGEGEFHALHALDSLFAGTVRAERGSAGYSFLADGSDVPVLDRCTFAEAAGIQPFRSTRFAMPGYARMKVGTLHALATGASNGAEIGAFNSDRESGRERLLVSALGDLLPMGRTHEIEWR